VSGSPPMPVFRLDSDTTAPRGAHARILAEFGEAASAVLVGTQMVAKGHDFPEVTLSAILDADATLRFPTSAPRSGPSRWSPSWPGAPGAARRGER